MAYLDGLNQLMVLGMLLFLLPLFVSLYIKDKGYKYLFYIIVIGLIDLLISTKACYYGLISTLIVGIIYLIIDFITKENIIILKWFH